MELEEFRSDFLAETAAWAASGDTFEHFSFVELAVSYLADAGEVSDFEPCYYRGTGSRRRSLAIDGYAFDEADGSLRVFVADPSLEEDAPTLINTEAEGLFGRLRAFVRDVLEEGLIDDLEMSAPAYDFASELLARRDDVTRIRAYLLTDAVLSSKARDWKAETTAGIPVEFHIWDISRFHRVQESKTMRDDLVVDFSDLSGGGLLCLEAGSVSDEYLAYLCVVPGDTLADIYSEYGSRLLEGNVRSFLTVRRKVNKGIRNTILHQPEMFFAFNNGIAATASEVDTAVTDQGLRITSATDLQIVNGGQTTASIASALVNDKAKLDGVSVPMKLSIVSPERSEDLIPQISRFANSQNTVSEADFFSNHPFHRRMEEISGRLWVPAQPGSQHETKWFYERVRGQYMNATFGKSPAEKKRFHKISPRDQVMTQTDLAKAENSMRRLPHTVSKGAQKNFLDFAGFVGGQWDKDADVFNEAYFRAAVAHVVLFRATEKTVSSQEWYSGGYRANIVTYTIAALSRAIERHSGGLALDTESIWAEQGLSGVLQREVATFAAAVQEVIVDPPAGVKNVTEWAKREQCWKDVQKLDLQLSPEVAAELADRGAKKEAQRDALQQQRQDSGIDAQKRVVELGELYWQGVLSWGDEKGLLPMNERELVRKATNFGRYVPKDWECGKLLGVEDRLELEGMAPPTDELV